jgi:hypothetical protein
MKIAYRFNGGKEICEKKQDFEARRSTEKARSNELFEFVFIREIRG